MMVSTMFQDRFFKKIDDIEGFEKVFSPEKKGLQRDRFSFKTRNTSKGLWFEYKAKDKTAFRTIETSLHKLCNLYDKISMIR